MNKLWQELFLELKILHTKTPPNIIERCCRTIVSILKTMGREMQEEWDLGVKAACLAYNTTVHTSNGQTQFFATFGHEAPLPPLEAPLGYIQFLKQTGRWNYPIIRLDRNN